MNDKADKPVREAKLAAIVTRNKKAARSRAKMKAARLKHQGTSQE